MAFLGPYQTFTDTGAAAQSSTYTFPRNTVIVEVRLHLSAGGAGDDFVMQIDSRLGAAFDIIVFSQNMNGLTDFRRTFAHPSIPILNGDSVLFTHANTNSRTFGMEVVFRDEV